MLICYFFFYISSGGGIGWCGSMHMLNPNSLYSRFKPGPRRPERTTISTAPPKFIIFLSIRCGLTHWHFVNNHWPYILLCRVSPVTEQNYPFNLWRYSDRINRDLPDMYCTVGIVEATIIVLLVMSIHVIDDIVNAIKLVYYSIHNSRISTERSLVIQKLLPLYL